MLKRKRKRAVGKFKFLDHLAIADVAFQAEGKTLEELFSTCALATFEVMVDTKEVKPQEEIDLEIKAQNLEGLLFNFISELIFLKDAKRMVFSKFAIRISKNQEYHLTGKIFGEEIDQIKHKVKTDVKAITYHRLIVKQLKSKWIAQAILDI
jgi:SHS2 domain-containing protein